MGGANTSDGSTKLSGIARGAAVPVRVGVEAAKSVSPCPSRLGHGMSRPGGRVGIAPVEESPDSTGRGGC